MAQTVSAATLYGTVSDPTGALIPQAHVHLSGAGTTSDRLTDATGKFSFTLPPGTYRVIIDAPDFTSFERDSLVLKPNAQLHLPVRLSVAGRPEEIDVDNGPRLSTDPAENASSLSFEGNRLNLLSDDPGTLRQQLTALAGGPPGSVQFMVDGFSGGRLPPKTAIRSIRINRNPYSAYYDQRGFGRIEIETKPGNDKLHGSLDFAGTDQPFNANNPYTFVQPPYSEFQTDGSLTGPMGKDTAFFLVGNLNLLGNNAVANAITLDPASLAPTSFSEAVPAPQRTDVYSARIDHQFSAKNFGYIRDEWARTHITNNGIQPLILPAAAFASNTLTNALQISDTQVLGVHAVNQTRFQYLRSRVSQNPNSTAPTILVEGAFEDGGNPAQLLQDNQDHFELQDLFEFERGEHAMRTGFRFRELRDANDSRANYNGQYTFNNITAYQQTEQFLTANPQPAASQWQALVANGGGPSQFSITTGQPNALLWNDDIGLFAEDDWKVTPNLTASYGLRFESQSALPDHANFAPRFGLAWAIHHGKRPIPLVTLRAGYGIFYDRFPAANLLQAIRQNGISQTAYFEQNPSFFSPLVMQSSTLAAIQPTIDRVNPSFRNSYQQIGSIEVDRMIGTRGSVSALLRFGHGTHGYLTRNINAPLPGTFDPNIPNSGIRPLGNNQNIYQYSADSNDNDEIFSSNANLQITRQIYGFALYSQEHERNEANGIGDFPSNQYDLRADYGRPTGLVSQQFMGGLIWTLPHGYQVQPYISAHNGAPFNITTGTDLNGDTIYNDRPAFATDLTRASVVRTPFGNFDTDPLPGQQVIPRNYGNSPGFVWLDLQANKSFHLGPRPAAKAAAPGSPLGARPDRPWELKFQVEAQNLLNHNNPGLPVGVLPSPGQPICSGLFATGSCSYFGHSLSLANDFSPLTSSNRTILVQSFFTF